MAAIDVSHRIAVHFLHPTLLQYQNAVSAMSNTPVLADNSSIPQTRRLKVRQTLGSLAYLDIGSDNGGIILNLSEDGLAFQAVGPLTGLKQIQLVIQLPQLETRIETSAEIVWLGDSAREAGVRFLDISTEGRTQIRQWIESQDSPRAVSTLAETPAVKSTINPPEQHSLIPHRDIPGDSRREKWLSLMAEFEHDVRRQEVLQLEPVKPSSESSFQPENPALKLVPARPKLETVPKAPIQAGSSPVETGARDLPSVAPVPTTTLSAPELGAGLPSFGHPALQNNSSPSLATLPKSPAKPAEQVVSPQSVGASAAATLATYVAAPKPAFDANKYSPDPGISKIRHHRTKNNLAVVALFVLFCVLCFEIGTWVGNLRLRNAPSLPKAAPSAAKVTGQSSPLGGTPVASVDTKPDARVAVPRAVERHVRATESPRTIPYRAQPTQPALRFAQQNSHARSAPTASPAVFTSDQTGQTSSNGSTAPTTSSADPLPENPTPRVVDGRVLQPSDRFNPCHLTYRVDPTYPPEAQRQGIEGTVKIHLVIAADGSVQSENLIGGPPQLVSAALDAAKYWRYFPALLNGQPVPTQKDIEIAFQLQR